MSMPKWLENIVFYEVYPATFQDTDGDGIGNIKGITQHLDYIKNLGCDGIWLNPCFESTFYDGGYDITDYKKVAKRYGTNEDLIELFEKAHALDMKILLDLVPGHTSIAHPWFQQSCKDEVNEYTDRYVWTDSIYEGCTKEDGFMGGSINGFFEREGCCGVNFFTIQPAINYGFADRTKPWMQGVDDEGPRKSKEAMKDIMRFWMDLGCDGFRIDMAHSMIKRDFDHKETIKFWQEFREMMDKEYPDCAMLSEWGDPQKALEAGFHMDFLLHFGTSHYMDLFRFMPHFSQNPPYFKKEGLGSAKEFVETYISNVKKTNGEGLMCMPSGNHDMSRLKGLLDEHEVELAFVLILSLPGVPFVYYGDEIGMRHLDGLKSVEGAFYRTGARSPMHWNHEKNDGFSNGDSLYIPMDSNENRPTIEDALKGENSIYTEVKKLIQLRKEHSALQSCASIEFIDYASYPLVFKREDEKETIWVVINPKNEVVSTQLEEGTILYSNNGIPYKEDTWKVPACSACIIQTK